MGMGMSRFPDPYETRDDVSHATVFLVALLLLLSVAAILFFGNAWLFAPVQAPSFLSSSAAAVRLPAAPTPAEAPTFTAPTPVPPLAGIPYRPTPNGTQSPTAATPAATTTGSPTGTTANATTTTTPPTTSTPTTPTPQPVVKVGNTGGDGVYLRHTPRLNDKWIVWRDGTSLTLTGAEADGDGQHWVQVRDPRGNIGWVPAQYVVR